MKICEKRSKTSDFMDIILEIKKSKNTVKNPVQEKVMTLRYSLYQSYPVEKLSEQSHDPVTES